MKLASPSRNKYIRKSDREFHQGGPVLMAKGGWPTPTPWNSLPRSFRILINLRICIFVANSRANNCGRDYWYSCDERFLSSNLPITDRKPGQRPVQLIWIHVCCFDRQSLQISSVKSIVLNMNSRKMGWVLPGNLMNESDIANDRKRREEK